MQKWRLSNRNHNDNSNQNGIYPPPTSKTPSTHTSYTTSTLANNGMKAIKIENGVSVTSERDEEEEVQRKMKKNRLNCNAK